MILVLTGTHHQPFDRLVRAADALARATGERVIVQSGTSRERVARAEARPFFTPTELAELADAARVVVAHAGPGSLFLAWDRGLRPIVVPRSPALGEHVDDHQLRFSATLGDRAHVITDVAALRDAVLASSGRTLWPCDPDAVTRSFVARFGALAQGVSDRRRARPGLRDRLRHLLFPPGSAPR